MDTLTFITGNTGKAKYLSNYFHLPIEHKKLDLEKIVKDKVERAYKIVQKPVLVEDISLVFTSLDKLPGPLIKWFFETLGNDGLCRLLDGYSSREAVAEVKFAFHDGKEVKIFSGVMEGSISEHPRGEAGFGWDPVFIPQGHTKTWAEMSDAEKHHTSMRKIALEALKRHLNR